jgi:UDP-N-acetyl-D-glucosamine dehydrogenase
MRFGCRAVSLPAPVRASIGAMQQDLSAAPRAGTESWPDTARRLAEKLETRTARLGVIGIGYVGLPLLRAFVRAGLDCTGFDIDPEKVVQLNAGRSYIRHIPADEIADMRATGRFRATADFDLLADMDAILICVPTPLDHHRTPDLSYVLNTGNDIAKRLRPGQLVSLESTTYPGTTRDELQPILTAGGLVSGEDFFVAFSPEREDPGNERYAVTQIPKVVAGEGEVATALAAALYRIIVPEIVTVSSTATAEAVKLTENIFRSVNIALVNELKVIYTKMGINVWDVIDAAKTKPFGFMPFYPGPGLGGHCIPIDPFYLSWKAKEFELSAKFIELAGEINTAMPDYVIATLAQALSQRQKKSVNGARILLLGLAYKKDVDDLRESPSLRLLDKLLQDGAEVEYYDPYIPVVPQTREYAHLAGRESVAWDLAEIGAYDVVLICTDHSAIDYAALVGASRLVLDARNATRNVTEGREKIVLT